MINRRGFTIVELLVVIVVIAILAAITVVAYNGIQKRAQDAQIRQVASQFTKALQRWSVESGKVTDPGGSGSTALSGGVCVGGGGGWVLSSSGYACTIDDILKAGNYIPATLMSNVPVTQPSRPAPYSTFMLYGCPGTGSNPQYAMMYALNTPDSKEITNLRNACAGGGSYGPIDTYGMNGGYVFSLSY
jgi:prepilin-type N-terminal cleavage/methylation domain-containing protein